MPDLNLNQLASPLPNPADVVTFQIDINDQPVPDNFEVVHISVNRCFNRIPYAIIQILDSGVDTQSREISDQDLLSPGNKIKISAGYESNNTKIFEGIIIKHALKAKPNQAPTIQLECKDKFVKMTVDRKNRYFADSTDSEIIDTLIRGHGLEGEVDDTSVNHAKMVQYYATDWDFMLTRAEANAHLVNIKDGKAFIKKPDFEGEPNVVLNYGTSIFEFEAEMDARDQYPAVLASSWDFSKQELIEVEANAQGVSAASGIGGAVASAANTVAEGVQTVAGATGLSLPGVPPNTDYTKVLEVNHLRLQHSGKLDQKEMENWAAAQFQKSKLAKLKGRVKFEGMPDIYPGDTIALQNVGLRHDGSVYVTGIKHEIGQGSWYVHAQFGLSQEWFVEDFPDVNDRSAASLLPAVNGLQIGLVTALANDPEGEDRIKVRLPILSNSDKKEEGIWVRIATQDGGENRGAFFRPDIGDEVVLGFLNDDPREAIVLGMLNSKDKPAPLPTTDANDEKGWITRSEIKMLFNDEQQSFTVETPGGNKLVINDNDQNIFLEDQHGNKITMDQGGITIKSAKDIKMEAPGDINIDGTNISISANAEFKAEGSAKSTLSSTGDVTVQGTFVKIN